MLPHHGVLAHDGQSLDGQPYHARDAIAIEDDGDQGALIVTNHRTRLRMLVSITSACWTPSHAQSGSGDTIFWTLYGDPQPSEGVEPSTTRTGRKAIQVFLGSALDVRRVFVSDEDLSTRARPVPSNERDEILWRQWTKMTSLQRSRDQDDSSDGSLSTGCSSPSSIPSPITPMNSAMNDTVMDLGSLEGSKFTDSFCSDKLPASSPFQSVPVSPATQFGGSSSYSKVMAPLHSNVKYADIPASWASPGMQDDGNSHGYLTSPGGIQQAELLGCMEANNVMVNYMCIPHQQQQQHQMRAPVRDGSPSRGPPQWNPTMPVSGVEWPGAYPSHPPQGFAQLGFGQQSSGPAAIASHTLPGNPSHQLPLGQRSLVDQNQRSIEMHGTPSYGPFVRHVVPQQMSLTSETNHFYGPPSNLIPPPPSGSQTASNASREPEPQPASEFRPDLVLNSFQHQIRPDIAVLHRAAQGDVDRPASAFAATALQLVQSKADETIGILETLRPGAEYAGVECQKSIRNTVNHILAGIQAVRQSAMDGREPAEDDRKELSKQVESLKALVGRMANLKADVLRDAPRKPSGSQASGAAPESDMSRTGATVAHPTAATTALASFHWGQTTPPPDHPPRMAIGHGHHPASFLHGMSSHATNMQQAMVPPTAPFPGFDPSGCSVDSALSGVTHSAMAAVMTPSTGPSPVTETGWLPYPPGDNPTVSSGSSPLPLPTIYPPPQQPPYGKPQASMYGATHGPLHSHLALHPPTVCPSVQTSETGSSLLAPGLMMLHASSFASPAARLGPPTDAQLIPGSSPMIQSVNSPSAAQDNQSLPTLSPVAASGRRGSVPERRLPIRERTRIAPYPVDRRSSPGRKGSI